MSHSQPSPSAQLDRLYDHPRDPPPLPHPPRTSSSSAMPHKTKKSKKAVTFNRLQLAAALIESDDQPSDPCSDIHWHLQEQPPQTHSSTSRLASQSAIFIPFRTTANEVKKPDFFPEIGLVDSKHSISGSGFGVVSTQVHSAYLQAEADLRRSMAGRIEGGEYLNEGSDPNRLPDEEEVLSEWGLDKLLGGPQTQGKGKGKASHEAEPHSRTNAQAEHDRNLHHRTGRLTKTMDERHMVKSDLFDLHSSDLRLQTEEPAMMAAYLRASKPAPDHLVLDDEELLQHKTWCDAGGRRLVRPHSVFEWEEARNAYLPQFQPRATRVRKPSKSISSTRALEHLKNEDSHPPSLDFLNEMPRTRSLSFTQAVNRVINGPPVDPSTLPPRPRPRRKSTHESRLRRKSTHGARPRRKSTYEDSTDMPSATTLPTKSTGKSGHRRTKSAVSQMADIVVDSFPIRRKKSWAISPGPGPIYPQADEEQFPSDAAAKLPRRTSTDIAQRYQQSIALLEARISEDVTYEVDPKCTSSHPSELVPDGPPNSEIEGSGQSSASQTHSTALHGSEFSIGAPKQFTSRFDPKVASILSMGQPLESEYGPRAEEDEGRDAEEEDGDDNETGADADVEDKPIYDEMGRIRFPTSLKPPVLIMPIPLTPSESLPDLVIEMPSRHEDLPEPYQAVYTEEQGIDGEGRSPIQIRVEDVEEETEHTRMVKKWEAERPAGKLYGRSLIDELNSRKGAQKSRQMTFTGDGRRKMFANTLSPNDVSRPESIYSNLDPDPNQSPELPKSPSSPSHVAYQALSATQAKFNQALINSSRARKSVFGMDKIMLAELEKLKRIKAAEEEELREIQAKAEAKENKRWMRRKDKKKKEQVEAENEAVAGPDQGESAHASQMFNHWDSMLLKESSPVDSDKSTSPLRYSSIPLPVLTALDTEEARVGNMADWFEDKPHENDRFKSPTPMFPTDGGDDDDDDDDDGFGNANSIARKLEIQADQMKYQPLPNVFANKGMQRGQSVESQAALLAISHQSFPGSPEVMIEGDMDEDDGLPLVSVARQKKIRQSHAGTLAQFGDTEEDDVPLAQHRKSMMPSKLSVDEDEDDDRPLSRLLPKLNILDDLSSHGPRNDKQRATLDPIRIRSHLDRPVSSASHSPISSLHSPAGVSSHSTDEDLPLGIRATILLARDHHPPIDLTYDNGSSEGPIGSTATHETDDLPLGVRASTLLNQAPLQSTASEQPFSADVLAALGSMEDTEEEKLADSTSEKDDDVPLGYRASTQFGGGGPNYGMPLRAPAQQYPRLEGMMTQSNRSIYSDDIPLGVKYDDDLPLANRLSTLNPHYASGGGQAFGRLSQFGSFNPYQMPAPMMRGSFMGQGVQAPVEEDADDDVPLARRASAMPPLATPSPTATKSGVAMLPTSPLAITTPASPLGQEIEFKPIEKTDFSPLPTPSPVKADNARADTLAALEGRVNPEENADDDVPLGVTRAAHTTTGGTVRRPTKKKLKKKSTESDDDDDDVPLGIKNHESLLSVQTQEQQRMMKVLMEQQNAAFGYPIMGSQIFASNHLIPTNSGHQSQMMKMGASENSLGGGGVAGGGGYYGGGMVDGFGNPMMGPDRKTVDTISRWRQDVEN